MRNINPPAIVRNAEDLTELAKQINARERKEGADLLEHAKKQGEDLLRTKKLCGDGKWTAWLRTNITEISPRQCQRYTRIADKWDSFGSVLKSPSCLQNALDLLTKMDEEERNQSAPVEIADDDDLEYEDTEEEERDESTPQPRRTTLNTINENPIVKKENRYITLEKWERLSEQKRENILATEGEAKFNSQGDNENIEWALWSWNPVSGCLHNCPYCYARDIAERFYEQKFTPSLWPDRLSAPSNTTFPTDKIELEHPGSWKRLGLGNVFVCSMADLFGRWIPSEWIEAVLEQCHNAPQWNFLFLTKFPIRMAEFDFPDNAWVGTTVDCQARVANAERAFRKIKAKFKWLSCEPLIEPLKFQDIGAFDWLVWGGASTSRLTPQWEPPSEWVANLVHQAWNAGCKVYQKSNANRIRQFPGFDSLPEWEAPPELRYLIPKDQKA